MLRPEGERDSTISRQVARNDLINEICLLSHLRHPCLVMFLGAVLSPNDRYGGRCFPSASGQRCLENEREAVAPRLC